MMLIITNNSKVKDNFDGCYEVAYEEKSCGQLLMQVRDFVHNGYRLLTHPLSGSVKPNETPYKSIVIKGPSAKLDIDSLLLIEEAIACYEKFENCTLIQKNYSEDVLSDFRTVDLALIKGALYEEEK